MEENYKKSIEEFKKYVENFDMKNGMISRKYYHTFRVADYAKELAQSENLNEQDTYIAFLCGLLHDIARFKQATEYGTFNDLQSFDHGDVGFQILLENDYISRFIQDKESQIIILKAVKNHNKFAIEDGLNEKELFFAKLVRDADKLDIMDIFRNEITDNSTIVDENVLKALKEHRQFKRDGIMKNDVSEIVKFLCFTFDLNLKRSFEILEEKGILKRKLVALEKSIDAETMKIINKALKFNKVG